MTAARVEAENQEPPRPTVVCLCGSTRFWREFQRASLAETLAGKIVLSIGAATGTDDEHFGNLPPEEYQRIKEDLDQLHLRKVEMADEVLILNVDGYVGESTARELAHAYALGKRIRFLEPEAGKVVEALKRAAELEATAAARSATGSDKPAVELAGEQADSSIRCQGVERHFAISDTVEVLASAPEPFTRGLTGRVLRWMCQDHVWFYTIAFDPEVKGFWTIAGQHLQKSTA